MTHVLPLLAFAPALAAAILVAENAVDVPVAQDWARADLLEPGSGVSSFSPGAAIPRLVARGNAIWFGGALTLEMALGLALVLVGALCVHGLLRRTFRDPASRYGTTFLANLLIFSPMQWENLLWAARVWFQLPMAALCVGLLAIGSSRSVGLKVTLCAALALITGLALPLSSLGGEPAGLGSFFALLGSPFARTTLLPAATLAPLMGVLVALFFVAGAGSCLLGWRDPVLRRRALPWLVIGGAVLAACAGLLLCGVAPADVLLSRYTGLSLWLCVAALPLGVLGVSALRERQVASHPVLGPALRWAPAFAAGVLGIAILLGWLVGLRGMQAWKSARLQARTSLVFLQHFEPVHLVRLGGAADLSELRAAADVLDRHGQLRPTLVRDAGFGPFEVGASLAARAGEIETAVVSGRHLVLAGFAWLDAGRPADGVLLTVRDGQGPRSLVGIGELEPLPLPPIPEHDHIYNHARIPGIDERAVWRARVSQGVLPRGPDVVLEAFAADAETSMIHPIVGEVELSEAQDGIRARLTGGLAP